MEYITGTEVFKKISEEKKNRIIASAIREFSSHGYESANINNIAKNAGVSVGAMYKYFANKEELYYMIVHYCVESLKAWLEEAIREEDTLFGRIEKIIRAAQHYARENEELNKIYNMMTTDGNSGRVWKIVSDMESVGAELYTKLITEAQLKGEIRTDANPKAFAYFLDNIFILLHFSYGCEYYKERLKMFIGEDVFENDDMVVEQLMKFIQGAFK